MNVNGPIPLGHINKQNEIFQILKDDAVKVPALNMTANMENSAVPTGLEKVSFHYSPKEARCLRMFTLQ